MIKRAFIFGTYATDSYLDGKVSKDVAETILIEGGDIKIYDMEETDIAQVVEDTAGWMEATELELDHYYEIQKLLTKNRQDYEND